METYYSGSLRIEIEEMPSRLDRNRRDYAQGRVVLSDGREWAFSDVGSGVGGARFGLLELAEAALSFGAYYTTHNRGDDTPEWAPESEIADAIEHEAFSATDETIPGFPDRGEPDEEETIFRGDTYCVFDSLDAQCKYSARFEG